MRGLALTLALFLCAASLFADDPPLITGQITIFGSKIEVSPAIIETPAGVPIFINTTGKGLGGKLVGELRGPSISGAVSFETTPGSAFQLPALTTKGTYFFEDIRLVNGTQILASATPDRVEIRVIDVLITQISSRPLSLDEIRSLGIVINDNDFSAVSFEVGLQFQSKSVTIEFPLLLPKKPDLQPLIPPGYQDARFIEAFSGGNADELPPPLPDIVPMTFRPDDTGFLLEGLQIPDIPGILVFPNQVSFLNQFFAVMLMVRNGAFAGSNLSVDSLTSQIVIDPDNLKLVKTNPAVPLGSPVPVRLPGADGQIGTGDDLDLIIAQQTAKAEFFVEGLAEGTHTVQMNLHGILHGLVQGDVPISGTAIGAVLVRNPNFSITFSHPSVVRAFEEYDLFVTVTNTSSVDANLVRLSIPSNALVNTIIKGDSYKDFEIIRSGESATAAFRMVPQVTGQVTAGVITSSGNVKGQFQFRVGVGEKGIPLSPNILILPAHAATLGSDVQQKALNLLGLAYSAATAPPGGLPPGVPYVNKSIVFLRAVELAQAGQRFQLGESRADTLSHLLLDWLGNEVPDNNFDYLRRTTEKGREFLDEVFTQMNVGGSNTISYHQTFADATFFRRPYLSLMLQSSGGSPVLSLSDSSGNTLSSFGGEFGPLTDLPYADLLRSSDGEAQWAIIGHLPQSPNYTLRITGSGTAGSSTLSVIVPVGSTLYRAQFDNLMTLAGKSYEMQIDGSNPSASNLRLDLRDEMGAIFTASLTPVEEPPLRAIAAVQDANADKTGHILAVLFNRPVTQAVAETLSNYEITGNRTLSAILQQGGRIVYLCFINPVSPLIDNDLVIRGMDPPLRGNNEATIRIQTTATTEAGRVIGHVLGSDGTPVAMATVQLTETDYDDLFGEVTAHVTAVTTTNAQGEFTFDYVRKSLWPFAIEAQDPLTGEVSESTSGITQPNQLLRLDIIFFGRGTVKGKVFKRISGTVVPVSNAIVTAVALNGDFRRVLTDASGNYLIDRLVVGNVNLTAQNQNLGDLQQYYGAASTAIPQAGAVVTADIEVTTYQPGKVSGRVLQANGVDPIARANVIVSSGSALLATSSDADGWFHFDQVPPGLVSLEAKDPGTGQRIGTVSVNLAPGGDVVANIVARGNGNIEVYLTLASGMNLSDVAVYIENTSFVKDPVSALPVLFQGVPVGTWSVNAVNKVTGDTAGGSATILYASSTTSVSLRFPEKGTISGNVKNVDGIPAPRATVLLFFGGGTYAHLVKVTTADNNGHYLFKDVVFNSSAPDDYYTVHAVSENQNDGGAALGSYKITEISRNAVADITFLGKGSVTVHVETSSGPVMTSVILSTLTLETDGRITRSISFTRTTSATTGDVTFSDLFRTGFTVETSTPFTLPAKVSGRLSGPSATVSILLTPNPNISGIVHDADGNPVQATVTYTGGSGTQTVTTAADGTFAFNRLAIGGARFTASAQGTKGQLTVAIAEVNDPIDIHLLGAGNVHGMIKDAAGAPVPGASVKMIVSGLLARTLQTSSRSDGTYSFTSVPEGRIDIEASNGIVGGRATGTIIHHADIPLDIQLAPTATVQGTLFQPDGTTRVPNAEVTLSGPSSGVVTADGNGNFIFRYVTLSHSSEDTYRLAALDKSTGRRAQSGTFVVSTNGEVVTRNLMLEARGSVSGFVLDFGGQNPVSGAQLTLFSDGIVNQSLLATSGSNGDFAFGGVARGSYSITAKKDLLAGRVIGQINTEGQQNQHTILLQPSIAISGSVVFPDGSALPSGINPVIQLSGSGVSQIIDAPDGQFRVEGLPGGTYTLRTNLTYLGKPYRGMVRTTVTQPGSEANVLLRLRGLNTLNVTLDGYTDNTTTVTLTYRNDMEARTESQVAPTGSITFLYVPESTYTVTAATGTLLKGSASGQFTGDNETEDILITLTNSGSVTGRLHNPQGQPASGAAVTLKGGGFTLFAYTDSFGDFRIDGVPLGSYTLTAEDMVAGGKARATGSIDTDAEVDTYDLTLDAILPRVISTVPAAGEIGVSNDSTIHVVFNEPMDQASLRAAFSLTSFSGTTTGSLEISGTELVFTPAVPLDPQKTYTIVVKATAEDVAGNQIGSDFVASFTTVDTVAPTVNTTVPIHLAYNVPLNTTLQVFFSEPIADRGTYTVARSSGLAANVSSETWNTARTVLTLTFAAPFNQNERITFTISGYKDLAGNIQTEATIVFFDTIDTLPPAPPVLSSSDGDNQIREGTTVTINAAVSESLVNVDFYIKSSLKLHDTISPYQYTVPSSLTSIAANGSDQLVIEATATDRSGNVSQKTTLVIKLVPDTPPQIAITTAPVPGSVYAGGTIRVDYNATDDGSISKVQIIVTGALNQTLDAGSAASGSVDVTIPATIADGSSIFIKGRATDDSGKSTTTATANFTVAKDTQGPVVNLVLPDPNTIYKTGQTILARATATDNARVSSVEFYVTYMNAQNQVVTQMVGSDSVPSGTSTFEVNFVFPRVDTLQIFARAIDPSGNSTDSAARTLHASFNALPTASITDPIDGSQAIQKTTLTLRATASDPDGTVKKVQFYAIRNGAETFLGEDTSGPGYAQDYTIPAWTSSYTLGLKAIAIDDLNEASTSEVVNVTAIPDPKSKVTGRVLDMNGAPVALASATLLINGLTITGTVTNTSGIYEFLDQSTIDGNYIVKVTSGTLVGETPAVRPTSPVTNMPDIVLRSLSTKKLPGLTSQAVTAIHWYDAAAEKRDAKIGFDTAWRFGVLQTEGTLGNAEHIHLSGYPATGFTPDGWKLSIVNAAGQLKARVTYGANTTDLNLNSQVTPVLFGVTNTGLSLQFDDGVAWRTGDVYAFASWYLELPSGIRGSKQAFPAQAIIAATSNEVMIYDASNDSIWMKFTRLQGDGGNPQGCDDNLLSACRFQVSSVDALYGKFYFGICCVAFATWVNGGVYVVDLPHDKGYRYSDPFGSYNGTISKRDSKLGFTVTGAKTFDEVVKDMDVSRVGNDIWIATSGPQTYHDAPGTQRFGSTRSESAAVGWDEKGYFWHAWVSGGFRLLDRYGPDLSGLYRIYPGGNTLSHYGDLSVNRDAVYMGNDLGIDIYDKNSGQSTVTAFSTPTNLAGSSNDVRGLAQNDFRLWAVTAGSGAVSVLDPFARSLLGSFSSPTTPSNDLSCIDDGNTPSIPLNLVVGTNNAGAVHIKGDYQNLAFANALIVLPGEQNPASHLVNAGSDVPIFQIALNNGSSDAIQIDSITFNASGTGNDSADLAQVSLYQDTDGNGELTSPDILFGSANFNGDNGIVTFNPGVTLATGNTIKLLLTYEWNDAAIPGSTYSVSLAGANALDATLNSGASAAILGLQGPLASQAFTLSKISDPVLLTSITAQLQTDRITAVYYYDAANDPAAAASDPNWRNGIVKTVGNPLVNPASNIVVSGTASTNDRIEIKINGDGTFSYRLISSTATSVPAFAGSIPISSSPVTVPGTNVSLTFSGTQWTAGDVFRIATWFTEATGSNRSSSKAFPDRAIVVATSREIGIYDADTLRLWLLFTRATGSCTTQLQMMPCSPSDLEVSGLYMFGGRLFFPFRWVNSQTTHGLYVVNFVRDEAFRLTDWASNTSKYFGSATAGTPRANIRERNTSFSYSNVSTFPLSTSSDVSDLAFYWNPANSVLYTAVAFPTQNGSINGHGINVIKWSSTPAVVGTKPCCNSDVAFGPDGALYMGIKSGSTLTIARSTSYEQSGFPITSRSISTSATLDSLRANKDGLFIGRNNGVLVWDPVTLADKTSYTAPVTLNGSNTVSSMDVLPEYLFVGTSSYQNGRLNIVHTAFNKLSANYSTDQGLPSNDITSVSVSRDPSNFVAVIGTNGSGVGVLRGTLNEVANFSGLTLRKRDLFVTSVVAPQNDVPLLWFDLLNDRATPASVSSLKLNATLTGNAGTATAKLYLDADLSGSVTPDDVLWGAIGFGTTMTFSITPGQTIDPKGRAAFLLVGDFPAGSSGTVQVSIQDNINVSATYGAQTALVTGAPISGELVGIQ